MKHLLIVLPEGIIARLHDAATAEGTPVADLLEQIVAAEIPEALAEAAAERLGVRRVPRSFPFRSGVADVGPSMTCSPNAAAPPALAEGAPGLTSPQDLVTLIVPGDGTEPEPDDACST